MIGNVASNTLTRDQAAKSFSGMIARFMPMGDAPLFGLTSMLKTETALQFQHGYFSKSMIFPSVTLSVQAAIADTVLSVTSTANIIPGMLLRPDGASTEVMLVQGSYRCNANCCATWSWKYRSGDYSNFYALHSSWKCIGRRFFAATCCSIQTVLQTNFTQIFRNTWAVTGTAAETKMIAGEGNVSESKMDCMACMQQILKKVSSGVRNTSECGTTNCSIRWMEFCPLLSTLAPANITTLGATTNFTQLETALDPVFNVRTDQQVGNERLMFVGGVARRILNNIGRLNGTYMLTQGQTEFGLKFSTLNMTRGTFRIIEHPLLNAWGSATSYAKMAIVVDMASFNLAYLGNRKTKAFDIIGEDGVDAIGGTLTTELTALIKNPQAFAVLYNFTAAAAG
jgi:hypothetical protein